MHMPVTTQPDPPFTGGNVIVNYTASGSEGVDFVVPIGIDIGTSLYAVLWAPSGVVNLPIADFPNGVGDRTSTQFRVVTAAALAAGEQLTFVLFKEA